jgi:hypothetical protein
MTPDTLADVEALLVRLGVASEPHVLTWQWRSFGMSSTRARTALGLLADNGRIERRQASNGHVTYWTRRQAARASA